MSSLPTSTGTKVPSFVCMYQIKSEYVRSSVYTYIMYVTLSNHDSHTFRDTLYLLSIQCHSCVSASARVNAGTDNFLHWFYGTHSSLHVFNRGPYVGAPDLSLKLLELVGSHGVGLSSPLESKGQEESSLSGRAGEWREGVGGGGRGGR